MKRRNFNFGLFSLLISGLVASRATAEEVGLLKQLTRRLGEIFGWVDPPAPKNQPGANVPKPHHKPYPHLPISARFQQVRDRILPALQAKLEAQNLALGNPVYLRIFKQDAELEIWMQPEVDAAYTLFNTAKICNFSGVLGPKLKEGDRQSPEGFYAVTAKSLNPNSSFHLSFNLGFPNKLEQSLGRTGSFLMVHGDCQSIGCYAMTDAGIEPIYTLVYEALGQHSAVPVHAFPFRMTESAMDAHKGHAWFSFWETLKPGFDAFESTKRPPVIGVKDDMYDVTPSA